MKLTIEPTESFFMLGDVMVRAWRGTTEAGEPVAALVAAVRFEGRPDEGEAELVSIPPPDAAAALEWARKITGDEAA